MNLIHANDEEEEYGEFPELGIGRISSFAVIKTKLEELNKAVSNAEFVTDTPIVLNIHSRNVPNLSLIDLPGYIQITTKDQPIELKEKISSICETYIKEPNVILAISAADVDLANSEALRSAKVADPNGDRTIGVLTKMDLISPQIGLELLKTQDYELPLGFIGVVCSGNNSDSDFFESKNIYADSNVGINHLRNRLSNILEAHLSKSLKVFRKHVQSELVNTDYQIKTRFNDNTPKTYLLNAIDSFKFSFQTFALSLKQSTIRNRIDAILFEKVSDICRNTMWINDKDNMNVNNEALDELTKSGMAKKCFEDIRDLILDNVQSLVQQDPWNHHRLSQEKILEITEEILDSETNDLIHQIENMIQPLKTEVEFNAAEWKIGKSLTSNLLKLEILKVKQKLSDLTKEVHSNRELRKAMRYVSQAKYDYVKAFFKDFDYGECPIDLIETSKKAIELEEYVFKIWNRNYFLNSMCDSAADCPDVYLSLIADRLASTSSLFIAHNLTTRVLSSVPRMIETYFMNLTSDQISEWAKENPEINQLLNLNHRRSVLTQTLTKITEME